MTIGDQASDDINKGIDRTAMTSMLNLRNVLELIHDTLNNGSFAYWKGLPALFGRSVIIPKKIEAFAELLTAIRKK